MKKRTLIIVIIICLVVVLLSVAGLIFFRPVPLIESPNKVVNGSEEYSKSDTVVSDVYYNGTDVTDRIDIEQFVRILSRYECRRGSNPFPYPEADMVWKINLIQDFSPVHIVLGKDSVRYEAANTGMYRIINPESLMDELNTLIQR